MSVIIIIAAVAIVAIAAVVMYNGLVKARNVVDNGWAQIDVQLTRRADLIPNLVETVKGYASHERETLDAVIAARQAGMNANTVSDAAAADGQLTGALSKLFALSEAYPQLKADTNFLALQEELASTENRVAYARQFYNDATTTYNTKTQVFPTVLIAKLGKFETRTLFEAPETARTAPTVSF